MYDLSPYREYVETFGDVRKGPAHVDYPSGLIELQEIFGLMRVSRSRKSTVVLNMERLRGEIFKSTKTRSGNPIELYQYVEPQQFLQHLLQQLDFVFSTIPNKKPSL